MEFTEVQRQYNEMVEKLAEITKKTRDEIEAELNSKENLEDLLTRAAEMFED